MGGFPTERRWRGDLRGLSRLCLALTPAFAKDPDGYWVEVIKRGGYDADATPYRLEPAPQ